MTAPGNDNKQPVLNLPPVVKALCLANLLVFAAQYFLPDDFLYALAFVPARYTADGGFGFAALTSPVTHMFVHGGWLHLAVNMGGLTAFGSGVERAVGGRRMLLLYFLSGLVGALAQFIVYPHDATPMVGASGAISGLFGAVTMMIYASGGINGSGRSLLPVVVVWIGSSVFFGMFGVPGVDSPVAWVTHIGGFIAGLLLLKPIARLGARPLR